ncbi:MAG: MtnX-like HAD-IB family phosphatase [Candidatus Omnitrophica bacterium]|nr:MtnX-like HAD-IB family phosphatase [Candidatus Omnitrophota bacterium]
MLTMNSHNYSDIKLHFNPKNTRKYAVIVDFDGTITDQDAVDGVIERFSATEEWKEDEIRWQAGEIGSAECMTRQLSRVRVTPDELSGFLSTIRVDKDFVKFHSYLDSRNIPLIVMSDGFDLFIDSILRKNDIQNLTVKCNRLKFENDRLVPDFPYIEQSCGRCAHCKKQSIRLLRSEHPDLHIIYIGDGRSDVCATTETDQLYAKNSLAAYCRENGVLYQDFCSFADILNHLSEYMQNPEECGQSNPETEHL